MATELLVSSLTANLRNILPEAFNREVISRTDLQIRTKTWLSDPKALQARLDLALIKLIDQGKVDEMLDRINKSAEFYEEVLIDLIANQITEVEKQCEAFNAKFKDIINTAVDAALSIKNGRAKEFIDELKSQCLKLFRDNYLAINLITDSDGYEGCDNEEENVFREKCLQLVNECTLKTNDFWNDESSRELSNKVLIYLRDVRREEVARPRCQAACPRCGSICIHPANHDTSCLKHDTYHQPTGLRGSSWWSEDVEERDTLWYRTCSTSLIENCRFKYNGEFRNYRDFSKVYPEWMDPRLIERLPIREYIFANYQEEISKKYNKKKCIKIPSDYYHDLKTIRLDLERAANLSQDKYLI